jgi:transcriptional regulator with XRE-family HTH domain
MTRSGYLTAAQVAERLGVSAKPVSRWTEQDRLAHRAPSAATAATAPARSTSSPAN